MIENQMWLQKTIDKINNKIEKVSERSKDKIPYTTINGIHDNRRENLSGNIDDGINWWTNGFWAGMLWIMYNETGNENYANIAKNTDVWLDQCFDDFLGLHHDVGFMWLLSSVANYRLTNDSNARRRGLHAANLLAGRFNIKGEFIRAWNDIPGEDSDTRGWVIIDSMFNIPLLYWAFEETKDPRFKHIAMAHADTVMNNFIRKDGSCEHIVEFDPELGGKVETYGGQGYANGSSWTRGQTWALYGFLMSYKHTGKKEYIETAKKVADYFISQIPEDYLIPVDFKQPDEPKLEDSTAAAIASCGLIELSKYVVKEKKDQYINAAIQLLQTLDEKRCDWSLDTDSILTHCTGAYHIDEHHTSIIYGDYFFMEAIFKLKGKNIFLW